MLRLHALLARGLTATAALWPDIRTAYTWVHRAAHLLTHAAGQDVYALRRAYRDAGVSAYPLTAVGALAVVDTFYQHAFNVLTPEISHTLGIPIVQISALDALARSVGSNRIVRGKAITSVVGDPDLSPEEERRFRKRLLRTRL